MAGIGKGNYRIAYIIGGKEYIFCCTDKYKLGNGGNAAIYRSSSPDNSYAAKVFCFDKNRGVSEVKRRYERFKREIKNTKEVNSRCQKEGLPIALVPIVGYKTPKTEQVITKSKVAFYVMPVCETFKTKARGGTGLPPEETLDLLLDVYRCLQTIHSQNLAHRDIKATNILKYNGRWLLSDFGLVYNGNESSELTQDGNRRVGPVGCPPELESPPTKGHNIDVYKKSDVYLFGKLVWQLFTKEDYYFIGPFKIHSKPCDRFCSENRNLPLLQLLELMNKAIRDDYEDRPSLNELEQYLLQAKDILRQDRKQGLQNVQTAIWSVPAFDYASKVTIGPNKIAPFMDRFLGPVEFELIYKGNRQTLIGFLTKRGGRYAVDTDRGSLLLPISSAQLELTNDLSSIELTIELGDDTTCQYESYWAEINAHFDEETYLLNNCKLVAETNYSSPAYIR